MNGIFGIGIAELFFIAIIALVVLGPERLPGTMREVAKYFRMARNLSSELTSQFGEELKALDDINPQKILQEVMEDPALDDINPKKIVKDLSDDKAKEAGKKSAARKPAAKKPAAKKKPPPPKSDDTKGSESDSATASSTAVSAASLPLAEQASDVDVETAQVDEPIDAPTSSPTEPADKSATADKPPSSDLSDEATASADAAPLEDISENRIAPDELATNLEQDDPDTETIASEPASLSVNGTHDSVEDRA